MMSNIINVTTANANGKLQEIVKRLQRSCAVDVHGDCYATIIALVRDRSSHSSRSSSSNNNSSYSEGGCVCTDVAIMNQLVDIVCLDIIMETRPSQFYLSALNVLSWIYSYIWKQEEEDYSSDPRSPTTIASAMEPTDTVLAANDHMPTIMSKIVSHLSWPLPAISASSSSSSSAASVASSLASSSHHDDLNFRVAAMKLSCLFMSTCCHCETYITAQHLDQLMPSVAAMIQDLSQDLDRQAGIISSLSRRDKLLLRGLAVNTLLHQLQINGPILSTQQQVSVWLPAIVTIAIATSLSAIVTKASVAEPVYISDSSRMNALMSAQFGDYTIESKYVHIMQVFIHAINTADFSNGIATSYLIPRVKEFAQQAMKLLQR
jgi:hypothetical protein